MQTGPVASSRITRCCGPAASGLTPPARPAWASPAYAAWDPEHNTLMVRRIHRTTNLLRGPYLGCGPGRPLNSDPRDHRPRQCGARRRVRLGLAGDQGEQCAAVQVDQDLDVLS